jgi:glycosyltransferase involved in cell wall biosynthesis
VPKQDPRYAFVTPYHKEGRACLERCVASVKRQTVRADHILVADGFPQDWLDHAGVRHLRLDRAHGDYGNTPRGIGSLMAVAEGYDGIGLLDADCWLEPDHLEHCLAQAGEAGLGRCGFVVTSRTLRRPDETVIDAADESPAVHVDTSCLPRRRTAPRGSRRQRREARWWATGLRLRHEGCHQRGCADPAQP